MRRPIRAAAGLAAVTVLSLVASGCVTVHGELAVIPSVRPSEAAKALKDFTAAYNAADAKYDPALDKGRVTGALGAINQAGLKSKNITNPEGNTAHKDLVLTGAHFTIPKKAGWPRWFVADAAPDGQEGGSQEARWMMVFVRDTEGARWKVAYLTILAADAIPDFTKDKDGYAEPVKPSDTGLAVPPGRVSADYAGYLQTGKPDEFAAGPHTDAWRASRAKTAKQPASTMQYIDQPLKDGDFAPLALRTQDGGALVFFATRYFQRQTTAKGFQPAVSPDVKPLVTGQVKTKLTKEWVSSQIAEVPAGAAGSAGQGKVAVVSRLEGVTGATGS